MSITGLDASRLRHRTDVRTRPRQLLSVDALQTLLNSEVVQLILEAGKGRPG